MSTVSIILPRFGHFFSCIQFQTMALIWYIRRYCCEKNMTRLEKSSDKYEMVLLTFRTASSHNNYYIEICFHIFLLFHFIISLNRNIISLLPHITVNAFNFQFEKKKKNEMKSTTKSSDFLYIFFFVAFLFTHSFSSIFEFVVPILLVQWYAVNNVGRMYDYPEELGKLSPDILWNMININMSSVTMMTRMVVNDMKKRGKGAIVNLSSGSELQPLPYAAVYGASKVSFI